MNSVCYECTERHEGCHGSCERYRSQKAKNESEKAERTRGKEASDILYDGARKQTIRNERKVKRGRK